MIGYRFTRFIPSQGNRGTFESLRRIFLELLLRTAGDVNEALHWMHILDREHRFTTPEYGMADFIEELREKGYIRERAGDPGRWQPTSIAERTIRQRSLEEIFRMLRKAGRGQHRTPYSGRGDEATSEMRPFQFGDALEQIAVTESLRNAQIRHGIHEFMLTEEDLEVRETEHRGQTSTVLLIDISHSMVLYGEDRITPAKKVALALAELIKVRYPQDTLDVVVFGNDAWQIDLRELPYLDAGPYYTNTVAGLQLALSLLRRKKHPNKQIFMITDGKPTCIREKGRYYRNPFGLDRRIVSRTLDLAAVCRRRGIVITTFMVAQDPYLQEFVHEFTRVNRGRAYYTRPEKLGEYLFEDFVRNRRKHLR